MTWHRFPDPDCPNCSGSGIGKMARLTPFGQEVMECRCVWRMKPGKVVYEQEPTIEGDIRTLWYCEPPPFTVSMYVVTADEWTDDYSVRHIYAWAPGGGWWGISDPSERAR